MPRKYIGGYVRHEYECDFCHIKTIHDYSAADFESEEYLTPSKEPAPSGWITGKLDNVVYYFDLIEHKNLFLQDYLKNLQDKF